MFKVEGSNLRFKFVDGRASEEDIMFLDAVCINVFCGDAVWPGDALRGQHGLVDGFGGKVTYE